MGNSRDWKRLIILPAARWSHENAINRRYGHSSLVTGESGYAALSGDNDYKVQSLFAERERPLQSARTCAAGAFVAHARPAYTAIAARFAILADFTARAARPGSIAARRHTTGAPKGEQER
jgi:hypothetical protein